MKTVLTSFFLISTLFLTTSCGDKEEDICDNEWSYYGVLAPDAWEMCDIDCGGTIQSPINITGAVGDSSLAALNTNYNESEIELFYNGHAIEMKYPEGSTIEVGGISYTLEQFHFHAQSEHTINGVRYPLETHLVHKSASGNLVVVSVLFETGAENAFLSQFSDNLPASKNSPYSSTNTLNPQDLIPAGAGYYTYNGSLTTPPCSEIATWFVLKTPLQASAAQLANFKKILKDNYRPIQALNGRQILSFN